MKRRSFLVSLTSAVVAAAVSARLTREPELPAAPRMPNPNWVNALFEEKIIYHKDLTRSPWIELAGRQPWPNQLGKTRS